MKLRLCRLSNLFRAELQKNCLLLAGLFLVLPVVLILLLVGLHPLLLALTVALNAVGFVTLLLGYPGSLQICEGVLSFAEYYEVSRGERKKIHFTVTDIRDVEYLQNRLEKRLNIGRIRFRGNAELEPCYHLPRTQCMCFQLCGIPDFLSFQARLEELLSR